MNEELNQFVAVLETHNAGDRVFLKSILDAEGISYYIQGEFVAPYVFNALPMRLMVRADQVERVEELLQNIRLSYTYGGVTEETGDEEDE